MTKQIIDFTFEHWVTISALLYELLARLVPTSKNWSLIDLCFKVLNFLIPNIQKKIKNPVLIFALAFAMSFVSSESVGQSNAFIKGLFSYDGGTQDTTALQANRTSTQNIYGNTGLLYFSKALNKWRIWDGSAYVDIATGSGGGDMILASVQTSTGKKTFQPDATNPGINVGSRAGDPTTPVNGDTWYNTVINQFRVRKGGITYDAVTAANAFTANQVPYWSGNSILNGSANFTFDASPAQLVVGNTVGTGSILVRDLSNNVTIQGAGLTAPNQFSITATGNFGMNPSTGIVTINSDPLIGDFYTPTLTNTTNITSSTAREIRYQRINDVVSFSGQVDFDATAAGAFVLRISLPYASNFTAVYDASGVATNTNVSGAGMGGITANVANDVLDLFGTVAAAATHIYYFSGSYRVK